MKATLCTRLKGIFLLTAGLSLTLPSVSANAQRTDTLPSGTVIRVKLDNELSSRTARVGQRFYATVVEGPDDGGLPYGTRFEGVVRDVARHSGDQPGLLDVDFTTMIFPNEDARRITATLASLDSKSVSRSADGRLVSKGTGSGDRLKWVGIGAGAGLLIGTLTKQSSLLSTILGAGLGYLYSETQNKKPGDVTLKAGTEFGIRIDRSFAYAPDTYRNYYRRNGAYTYPDDSRTVDPYRRRTDRPLDDPYYDNRSLDPAEDRYYRSRVTRNGFNGDLRVTVDGRDVRFASERPFIRNGIVMIPLRDVARTAGVTHTYDPETRMLTIRGRNIRMNIDNRFAMVDGRRTRLSARPEIRNGVLFAPMDFVALMVDGDANYDADMGRVQFTMNR